jgi:ornithine decarboxylase
LSRGTVTFVDIGGVFYSPNTVARVGSAEIGAAIENALEEHFGDADLEVIAEPVRFIAAEYLDLNMPVIGVKDLEDSAGSIGQNVYIPDGIYGAFCCLPYDHAEPHFDIVAREKPEKLMRTNLCGHTCNSMDVIYKGMMWPRLEVGDFMIVRKLGAYTYSLTAFFNGFPHHRVITVNEDDDNENLR